MKCTEIRDELEKRNIDNVWNDYVKWVETLIPFWQQAIIIISGKIDFDKKKRDKHLSVIENYISFLNDWAFQKIKHVKARRNEIDSAISFIRNNALNKKVSKFLFAPMCRNVAGVLRHALSSSVGGIDKQYLPTTISQDIFGLAEIYTYFPFYDADFICFLPAGKLIHTEDKRDLDNYNIMLKNAGSKLGIEESIIDINNCVNWIWKNFKSSQIWEINDEVWRTEIENISAKLHYNNMKQFYNK